MAKEIKTISDKCDYAGSHVWWNTLVKVTDPHEKFNMIFKIEIDVCNGSDDWCIYVWSPASYAWNRFANKSDIPGMERVSYIDCCSFGTKNLNPKVKDNHARMVDYIVNFCNEI